MNIENIPKYTMFGDGDMMCIKEDEIIKKYPDVVLYVKLNDIIEIMKNDLSTKE